MSYTIRYNRTTNHIEGIVVRAVGGGNERGGVVSYAAQNACGSITRYPLAQGKSYETLTGALAAAEIAGGRKICRTCKSAAEAQIAADEYHAAKAAREAEDAQPTHVSGVPDTPSATMPTDNSEGNAMSNAPAATMHTVKVGFEGKTYHLWDGSSALLLCGRKADGPTVFDHLEASCKTCVKRAASADTATEETATMAAKKSATPAPTADKPDTDQLLSDFHDTLDRLRAVVAEGSPSKADMVDELAAEADAIVGKLPTGKRVQMRAEIKAAKEAPAAPDEAVSGTVMVKEIEDLSTIEGMSELTATAEAKIREGIRLGKEAAESAEEVAKIIINMRSKAPHPNGLPDLMSERKPTKDSAKNIFAAVRAGISDEDATSVATFNSIQRSIQNKYSDVLVDWIRAMDQPESWETFADLFPEAAEMVAKSSEEATKAHEEAEAAAAEAGEEFNADSIPAPLSPSEALYKLYESKGVKLTRKGRTELQREKRTIDALNAARLELVAATDAADDVPEDADKDTKAELEKAAEAAATKVQELEAKLPAETLKALPAAPVAKTKGVKLKEKVTKSRDVISAVTEESTFKKLTEDEKATILADLEALAGFIGTRLAALRPAK